MPKTLTTTGPSTAARPLWLIVLSAGIIVGAAMGLRQVMGLYLEPMTTGLKIGREPFSTGMAIANLVWGIGAVFAGAIADRYGAGRVIVGGLACTAVGLYLMFAAQSSFDLYVSGVLLGLGVSGTGITALVGAVGRAAPPELRTQTIASLGMASGIGGFIAFPYTHLLIEQAGWKMSLVVLAVTALAIIPFSLPLVGKPRAQNVARAQTLRGAFTEAFAHPSFWLLIAGFFVCGFHVAFYAVHLPAFVADKQLPPWVGVAALTGVALANIVGTFMAGRSGKIVQKRTGLAFIYFMRCFVFLGLLFLPINAWTVIGLSIMLGLFWLSTVPLTSTLVATFFGTTWMSMLFGFVFLSHQVGSFLGLWLAGRLYDLSRDPVTKVGSYDTMWWICIGLGLFAALVHWPIKERPVARLAQQAA